MCIIIILVIGDRAFSELIAHYVLKSGTKFSRTYRGQEAHDIIIMGNSRGDSSFCPKDIHNKTGLSTFQLSHKGVSTEIIECLWNDYLKNNSKPKTLILEITNLCSSNEALADLKAFMYWSNNISDLLKKENFKSYLATKLSNLYIWNGEILFRSLYFIGKSDQNKIVAVNKSINSIIAKNLLDDLNRKDNVSFQITDKNINALKGVLNSAQKNDIIVHLIFPPFIPLYVDLIDDDKRELIDLVISMANQYSNVYVHDMSRSIQDTSMFKDLTHLNYKGSKKLLDQISVENIINFGE